MRQRSFSDVLRSRRQFPSPVLLPPLSTTPSAPVLLACVLLFPQAKRVGGSSGGSGEDEEGGSDADSEDADDDDDEVGAGR